MRWLRELGAGCLLIGALSGWSAMVQVTWQTSTEGEVKEQACVWTNTASQFTSCEAPWIEGYRFVGWSIDTKQEFASRDAWGRSLDSVSFVVYEKTTLTANYMLATTDEDEDGLCDAKEMYWFGDLDEDASSDTDGDGISLLEEFTEGLNPHFADRGFKGIATSEGELADYNPSLYPNLVMRSEPEGELFATTRLYVKPGTQVTTREFDPYATRFAYWATNGVRLVDAVGQALNVVTFLMPDYDIEVVAVCEMAYEDRARLHWYGDDEVSLASDTDGDGLSLAEELAEGTNPLLKDRTTKGVAYARSGITDYNPHGYCKLTVACDPEGILFTKSYQYVAPGKMVVSPSCRYADGFLGWTMNGVRQADVLGRALDEVSFAMPNEDVELLATSTTDAEEQMQEYWYGTQSVPTESDTDGDGYTLKVEVAAGTNPLLKDRTLAKGVATADTNTRDVDIQQYEQPTGALLDNAYAALFYSGYADNAEEALNFGANLVPYVADVSGDGLWDIVLVSDAGTNVLVNVGTRGNPAFTRSGVALLSQFNWSTNTIVNLLVNHALDVVPEDGLSATYGVNGEVLVSDVDGRIWYYQDDVLHHKVWGGSYDGFANGLMLAAVDWEDDGDLDCLCGTAEGCLMLLRDPKVGRPTGLEAAAGEDNVLLTWDPNQQTRVRGYRVYRNGVAHAEASLPTYRDTDLLRGVYAYKVGALSRFYRPGNSTPQEAESPLSEVVEAEVGRITFTWSEFTERRDGSVVQELAIDNAMHYQATGLVVTNTFDAEAYSFVRVEKSRLSRGLTLSVTTSDGQVVVTVTGGEVAAGRGTFLTFVFSSNRSEPGRVKKGDLDGDGDVDADDLRLLGRLKDCPIRSQDRRYLDAGDLNRNGRLDSGDYQLLRRMLQEGGAE